MKAYIDDKSFLAFKQKFTTFQKGRPQRIGRWLSNAAEVVVQRSKTHYLTGKGGGLNVQTGRGRASVTKTPSSGAKRIGSTYNVDVGSDVWYLKMWELGWNNTSARFILPKKGKALKMTINGKTVFAKWARFNPTPRKWLQPSIDDSRPRMFNILSKAGIIYDS